MLQAIILNNKIFLPCTCIYEEGATLYGSTSYKITGYVTPDLTYFMEAQIGINLDTEYELIELNEDSPYRNFQFEDLDIEKLEIPYKYYSKFAQLQPIINTVKADK